MINILDLKQDKIKKTYNIGGQIFHLYNLNFDQKNKIVEQLINKVDVDNGVMNITDVEFGKIVLSELTDIDFKDATDEKVKEIFDNPCPELQEIFDEGEKVLIESREKIVQRLEKTYKSVKISKDEHEIKNKIKTLFEELGIEDTLKAQDNIGNNEINKLNEMKTVEQNNEEKKELEQKDEIDIQEKENKNNINKTKKKSKTKKKRKNKKGKK